MKLLLSPPATDDQRPGIPNDVRGRLVFCFPPWINWSGVKIVWKPRFFIPYKAATLDPG